jgi:hypothetical protein
MSFIIYDRTGPTMARMNYEWSLYRRFDNFWPKTDNLYNSKVNIYNHPDGPVFDEDDKVFTKFLNSLGLKYEDVLGSEVLSEYRDAEIDDLWFELIEPNVQSEDFKYEDAVSYITDFTIGQYFEVEFVYGKNASDYLLPDDNRQIIEVGDSDPNNPDYSETVAMEAHEIRDEIMSDPGMYLIGFKSVMPKYGRGSTVIMNNIPFLDNYFEGQKGVNYPFTPCIDCNFQYEKYYWYALFDSNEVNFEVVDIGEPRVFKSSAIDQNEDTNYGVVWRVKYRVKQNIDETSPCLIKFIDAFNSKKYANRNAAPLPFRITQKDYQVEYPLSKYPEFWENGQLKVQETKDDMKKKDFAIMLSEMFSSDYSIQEPEWWEKLLGGAVAIIGAVVGVVLCCTGTGATLISIGYGLLGASITWSLGSLALAAIGGPSTYAMVKNIAGVAQISSIVGSIFTFTGYVKKSWKGIKDYFSEKIDNLFSFFEFDGSKTNVVNDTNYIVSDVSSVSTETIQQSVEYMIDNNIDFETIFPNADFTDGRIKEAFDKYIFEKRLDRALAQGFIDLAQGIYNNYQANMYIETMQEYDAMLQEYSDLIKDNAPGNYEKVLGDAIMSYSFGSFDAISMLDLKIEQQIGANTIESDPTIGIT